MSIHDRFNLSGRNALVTGASRGIGRAIAIGLAQHGADVAVHFAGNREAAQSTADVIAAAGRRTGLVQGDLGGADAARDAFDQTLAFLERIDILVLNASIQFRIPWDQVTPEQFDQQINVNLRSSWELIQLALPGMIERGWGRILQVGSVQEERPHPHMPIYAATKAAMSNLVRNMAKQVGQHGVTVNNLAPGVIDTDRNADALADPQRRRQIAAGVPLGRIGQAEDCVGAAILLCSDAGSYITGIDLFADGGLRLP